MPSTPSLDTSAEADLHGLTAWPAITQEGERDALLLAAGLAGAERLLAGLPAPSQRTRAQQAQAQAIHRHARLGRRRFMRAHAGWVYDQLTDQRRKPLRLAALCEAAAEAFPGLVPDAAQMAQEAGCLQAHKEGREQDQALFLAEILRVPALGQHALQSMRQPKQQALALRQQFEATGELRLATVHLQRVDGVAHLTVLNADTLNAEDNALVADLETAVDLALLDPQVRVGLLRGGVVSHPKYAGKRVFSAGINLKHLHHGHIAFVEFLLEREAGCISKIYQGLLVPDGEGDLRSLSKPWLAAVDTFAIGGGAQLLLVFDRVIAASDSYFCLPAAQEGIVPGVANLRLARFVGAKLARQIILDGRKISASESEATLLLDEIVAPEDMDAAIAAALQRLDNPAVVANRAVLNRAEEPLEVFRAYMADFAMVQADRAYSADVHAKVERRATAATAAATAAAAAAAAALAAATTPQVELA